MSPRTGSNASRCRCRFAEAGALRAARDVFGIHDAGKSEDAFCLGGLQRPQSFLGGDEVALDVQMHGPTGFGNGLADYLFYFFFSPRGIVWMGARKLTRRQRDSRIARSDDDFSRFECSRRLQTRAYAGGFLLSQLSPGVLFRVMNGVELAGGFIGVLSDADGKVEANGLTFYVFEAQGVCNSIWRRSTT